MKRETLFIHLSLYQFDYHSIKYMYYYIFHYKLVPVYYTPPPLPCMCIRKRHPQNCQENTRAGHDCLGREFPQCESSCFNCIPLRQYSTSVVLSGGECRYSAILFLCIIYKDTWGGRGCDLGIFGVAIST